MVCSPFCPQRTAEAPASRSALLGGLRQRGSSESQMVLTLACPATEHFIPIIPLLTHQEETPSPGDCGDEAKKAFYKIQRTLRS